MPLGQKSPPKRAPRPGASRRSSPGPPWSLTLCWSAPGPEQLGCIPRSLLASSKQHSLHPGADPVSGRGLCRPPPRGEACTEPTPAPAVQLPGALGKVDGQGRGCRMPGEASGGKPASPTSHLGNHNDSLGCLLHAAHLCPVASDPVICPYPCSPAQPPRAPATSWPLGLPVLLSIFQSGGGQSCFSPPQGLCTGWVFFPEPFPLSPDKLSLSFPAPS